MTTLFPTFTSTDQYLNSLINYEQTFPLGGQRDGLKLEPCLRAVERLGLYLRLPNCVHIAGTKGKGSTVAFLESLLSPDYSTLSFTSPHLESVKERVRLNGRPLEDDMWCSGFSEFVSVLKNDPAIKLTYFETVFIFYLWAARQLHPDVHLVEVGLGGKWDATNILQDTLAVITTIDYDHTEILGNTLAEIAADKAGIIKPDSRALIGRQPEEALAVLRTAVAEAHVSAAYFGEDFAWLENDDADRFDYRAGATILSGLTLRTPGIHQRDNAAVAICAARRLYPELHPDELRRRLSACTIPGRQQLLHGKPDILLDVAHNPVSFRALAETLHSQFAGRRILAVVGMMKDKDARSSLHELKALVQEVIIVHVNSPRSFSANDLCAIAESEGLNSRCLDSREEAFALLHDARSEHNLGLVAGSFYLAGDYLTWRHHAGIA